MNTADLKKTHYVDYASYQKDQAAKLEASPNGEAYADPPSQVKSFRSRFEGLGLPPGQEILCCGARRGEEVRAWQSLGHHALGIDLNPGANNTHVIEGDFHFLPFPEGRFSVVYSNSLDHAFDWIGAVTEWRRVLRGDGWLLLDLIRGYGEGYQTGGRDCLHWPTAYGMAGLVAQILGWTITYHRDLSELGIKHVLQVVLRGPAIPPAVQEGEEV